MWGAALLKNSRPRGLHKPIFAMLPSKLPILLLKNTIQFFRLNRPDTYDLMWAHRWMVVGLTQPDAPTQATRLEKLFEPLENFRMLEHQLHCCCSHSVGKVAPLQSSPLLYLSCFIHLPSGNVRYNGLIVAPVCYTGATSSHYNAGYSSAMIHLPLIRRSIVTLLLYGSPSSTVHRDNHTRFLSVLIFRSSAWDTVIVGIIVNSSSVYLIWVTPLLGVEVC